MRFNGEIVNESNPGKLLRKAEELPSGMKLIGEAIDTAQNLHGSPSDNGKTWADDVLKNKNKDHGPER